MILSIDPGLTGAIALLSDAHTVKQIWDMPVMAANQGKGNIVNPYLLADIVKEAQESGANKAYIEAVHAMPSQGVSSSFKFGSTFGVLQGVVATVGLSMHFVTPQRWKKYHGLIGRDKDAARTLAIQQFPEQTQNLKRKKDGGRADAIMIGQYGWSLI